MEQTAAGPMGSGRFEYSPDAALIPPFEVEEGKYSARFVRDANELDDVLRLRYRVFNLELGEGLDSAHEDGLDRDDFDAQCHHLMVVHQPSGEVIGTYRMQTSEMAARGAGFYSAGEFRLEDWPAEVLKESCEVGRACISAEHRQRRVLLLLWRGLGSYVLFHRKRYFFGCCSLTSQDPMDAAQMADYLRRNGHIHPELDLEPRPDHDCHEQDLAIPDGPDIQVPTLMGTYLRYGARICGRPAIDREFRTIDFLALLDLDEMDPERILRQFEVDLRERG